MVKSKHRRRILKNKYQTIFPSMKIDSMKDDGKWKHVKIWIWNGSLQCFEERARLILKYVACFLYYGYSDHLTCTMGPTHFLLALRWATLVIGKIFFPCPYQIRTLGNRWLFHWSLESRPHQHHANCFLLGFLLPSLLLRRRNSSITNLPRQCQASHVNKTFSLMWILWIHPFFSLINIFCYFNRMMLS